MSHLSPATVRGRAQRQAAVRRNTSGLPVREYRENLIRAYAEAQLADCASWYQAEHDWCQGIADAYGYELCQVVGVVAALSPSCGWDRNKDLALDMLEVGDCAHMYGEAIAKARRIRAGERPEDVLGGRKVRSFYRNLLHPAKHGAVTLDRHAYGVLLGRPCSQAEYKELGKVGVYPVLAGVYREVAQALGMPALELQSMTWEWWRMSKTTTTMEVL